MKSHFTDFFPIPAFLEMRPVGLAISEKAIHFVEFVKDASGLKLGRFAVRPVPPGAIKEGYVNDISAVTKVLSSIQSEFSIEFVNASLPEEKAYFFKTEFPKSSLEDVRQAVELRLEENVPISANDAIFDYELIPGQADLEKIEVGVSVLPSKVVATYLDIIKGAGLKPLSFGVEASAISKAVVPRGELTTCMVVNVGEIRTSLSIVCGGVVQFNLTVPIGGEALTVAISKHFSVNMDEAKKIKEERGFVRGADTMELFFSIMGTISAIKDEINKLFIYWQTHQNSAGDSGKKIEKIILCGRDTSFAGLDEYLSVAIKVPVEVANVWQNAFTFNEHIPGINFLDSLDYASAIGLALPQD